MRPLVLALALLVALAGPAAAHRLKLFATVEDGAITGYGFFIGGGRPQGATLVIRDAAGAEVHRGATDAQGAFSWRPPEADDFTLVIDARDGHVADTRIGADRFAGTMLSGPAPTTDPVASAATAPGIPSAETAATGALDPTTLAETIDRAVDRAVARQIRPLLEAYGQADGRIRLNDVAGGVGMIIGLAGIAIWASGRRRARPPKSGGSS